ncbi:hypothetical protein J6590_039573 [Homalodisca vitripennis]|nr:hypothetical protein J6590_039573 [Homalodisca vitripennis]
MNFGVIISSLHTPLRPAYSTIEPSDRQLTLFPLTTVLEYVKADTVVTPGGTTEGESCYYRYSGYYDRMQKLLLPRLREVQQKVKVATTDTPEVTTTETPGGTTEGESCYYRYSGYYDRMQKLLLPRLRKVQQKVKVATTDTPGTTIVCRSYYYRDSGRYNRT